MVIKKPLPKSKVVKFPPLQCHCRKSSVTPLIEYNVFGASSNSAGLGEGSSSISPRSRSTRSVLDRGSSNDLAKTSPMETRSRQDKQEDQSDATSADGTRLSNETEGSKTPPRLKKGASFASGSATMDLGTFSPRNGSSPSGHRRGLPSRKTQALLGAEDHLVITLLCRSVGCGYFLIDLLMDEFVWLLFCGASMLGSMLGLLSLIHVLPEHFVYFMYANVLEFVLRICLTDTRVAGRLIRTFEWHFLLSNFILVPYAGVYMIPSSSAFTFNTLLALNCVAPLFIDASIMTSRHNLFTTLYLIALMAVYGYYVWMEGIDGALYDLPLFWGFTTAKKVSCMYGRTQDSDIIQKTMHDQFDDWRTQG